MLWLKALHVVFVVTWFAGLFYLPRLLIYHGQTQDESGRQRFCLMERRLLLITHIGAALALLLGLLALNAYASLGPGYLRQGWLHAKLALVALLLVYHVYLVVLVKAYARERQPHSERWLRLFNEVPGLLLIGIVILVVVKPF